MFLWNSVPHYFMQYGRADNLGLGPISIFEAQYSPKRGQQVITMKFFQQSIMLIMEGLEFTLQK